ncbi:MAG: hypothetical protein WC850_01070 [Candidatus Gracilibacteria bacterium]
MKKNNYGLSLAIIILGILLIILIFKYQREKSDIKTSIQTPTNVVFPTEEPIVNDEEKSSTGNLDKTQNIEKEEIKNTKLKPEEEIKQKEIDIISLNRSGETGKKELCNDITNQELKIKCIDNSYAAKASIDNNSDLCSKITDIEWQNKCLDNYYNNNALKLQDYNLCKKIISTNLKENCTSSIIFQTIESPDFKGGIEICNELNKESKINCESKFNTQDDVEILQKAVISLDINSCSKILNIELKNKCQDVINFKLALNLKDVNKCSLITDKDLKNKCSETLIKIN